MREREIERCEPSYQNTELLAIANEMPASRNGRYPSILTAQPPTSETWLGPLETLLHKADCI